MNVNSKIRTALKPFGYPVEQDLYTKGENEYFTFTYADERIVDYANNRPQNEMVELYINLYIPAKMDYMQLKKKVAKALFDAGFTYPSIEQILDMEAKKRHLIFNCKISGKLEMEE